MAAPPPPRPTPDADESKAREHEALGPVLGEALEKVLSVLRNQGRQKVGELARRGRERLEIAQARRDLDKLYQKLGREVVRLVEAGELDHPTLRNRTDRIAKQEEVVRQLALRGGEEAEETEVEPDAEPG